MDERSAGWAELLRRTRLKRGLNQRVLGAAAGMTQSQVAWAESGKDVRLSTMERLMKALGCRLILAAEAVVPMPVR